MVPTRVYVLYMYVYGRIFDLFEPIIQVTFKSKKYMQIKNEDDIHTVKNRIRVKHIDEAS